MEVEAAIQLEHDLDETGMPCVCISVGLLGVLLDLPERVWNIVQTLHTRGKVCKVCMPDFCRLAHSGQVCKVRQMHTLKTKYALSIQQVCTKCAECAWFLHQVCISTRRLSGTIFLLIRDNILVDKFADYMHTLYRLMQIWCRISCKCASGAHFCWYTLSLHQVNKHDNADFLQT